MTDHEWVDWVIEKTNADEYIFDPELKHDELHGDHYVCKYKDFVYVFIPRRTKLDNAEFRAYEPRDRNEAIKIWKGHSEATKKFYEARYAAGNYHEGFGYLWRILRNSKVYKIEKAILAQIEREHNVSSVVQ